MQYIELGKISKVHGLRGLLKLYLYNTDGFEDGVFPYETLYLQDADKKVPYEVERIEGYSQNYLVKFLHIDSRTDAEPLQSSPVFVLKADLPPLRQGEFYFNEIIGYDVKSVEDVPLGTVKGFFPRSGQPLLVIDYHQSEVLLPAVKPFLVKVDSEKRCVIIDPIDGLFE